MNAHQWLDRATRELPEGVAGRVEQETRAHLQDAGVPEGADVRAVLGDPETTNDGLRRLYLTAKELEEVATGGSLRTGWNLSEWLPRLLPVFWVLAFWGETSQWWPLALYVPALILVQRLHSLRRRHWQGWLFSLFVFSVFVPETLVEVTGTPAGWLLASGLLLYSAVNFLKRDARLRRTLLAGEGRA
ncbi:hypothetical protein QOL99_01470 [Deinococcus sp. MIMF12]|uniref:DUF2157 domain-containing protein n=1 Tax=Deinococcus rhizophilus TaxID=3049544 RepID=A0ABT7JCP7_9DEIO|nr:hypothetical protein [Deinococcus rhizophilus]MDL2342810.1 hypothetical protein [Deinococcus rhizophilus]